MMKKTCEEEDRLVLFIGCSDLCLCLMCLMVHLVELIFVRCFFRSVIVVYAFSSGCNGECVSLACVGCDSISKLVGLFMLVWFHL